MNRQRSIKKRRFVKPIADLHVGVARLDNVSLDIRGRFRRLSSHPLTVRRCAVFRVGRVTQRTLVFRPNGRKFRNRRRLQRRQLRSIASARCRRIESEQGIRGRIVRFGRYRHRRNGRGLGLRRFGVVSNGAAHRRDRSSSETQSVRRLSSFLNSILKLCSQRRSDFRQPLLLDLKGSDGNSLRRCYERISFSRRRFNNGSIDRFRNPQRLL